MIKVGIIGCGSMGRIHAECLESLGGTEIAAVQDIHFETAVSFAKRFGGIPYRNQDELLSRADVDCVYICTRHDSHLEIVKKAIEAKKPIFCEKPLSMELDQSEEISKSVRDSHLPFMIGFNQRRSPGVIRLKKQLESAGRPTIINLSVSCVNFLDEWMGKAEQGGGILTSLACHAFDLLRHVTGEEIVELSCFADRLRLGNGYLEDCGVALCRFESGIVSCVSFHDHGQQSYVMEPTKAMFRLEVHTATHSLLSHCHSDFLSCSGPIAAPEKIEPNSINRAWGYIETNRCFIDALVRGIRPEPNEEDGLIADRLVHAAKKSTQERRAITLHKTAVE